MAHRGRKRKIGVKRKPCGKIANSAYDRVEPTTELLAKRREVFGDAYARGGEMDDPIDVLTLGRHAFLDQDQRRSAHRFRRAYCRVFGKSYATHNALARLMGQLRGVSHAVDGTAELKGALEALHSAGANAWHTTMRVAVHTHRVLPGTRQHLVDGLDALTTYYERGLDALCEYGEKGINSGFTTAPKRRSA